VAPTAPATYREKPGGGSARLRGYFANFDKGRGTGAVETPIGALAVAEAKIVAHFAVTHRDPEEAAASFRAMLREKPKMALWTAHKHPIAFGEPTGIEKRGLQWKDVRELVTRGGAKDAPSTPTPPRSLDPVLAGERKRIREQTTRARAGQAGKRAPAAIGRSLARLAERIERDTPTDADAAKGAAHIREVVRGLSAPDGSARDQAQDQGRRIDASKRDPAALYRELEQQLRRRDKVRGKVKAHDRGDGGLDR
jgi:hypothetical protein